MHFSIILSLNFLSYHIALPHTHKNAIIQMLVRSLVKRGFACCEAEDGLEALSEMLRSSNQTTRKLPSPILSIGGSIVSPDDAAMAGGGAG